MATFTAVRNKKQTASTMVNVIEYVTQVAKTMLDGRWLVTGSNCVAQSSYLEMVTTKQRLGQVDGAILQDVHPHRVPDRAEVLGGVSPILQDKHLHRFVGGVYDPVFPHPGPLIKIELGKAVMARGGRRKDLHHQIGRTLAAGVVQLGGVAHCKDIWRYHRVHIFRAVTVPLEQPDSKGHKENLTRFSFGVIGELHAQVPPDFLVNPKRHWHLHRNALNQLPVVLFVPRQDICHGVVLSPLSN